MADDSKVLRRIKSYENRKRLQDDLDMLIK